MSRSVLIALLTTAMGGTWMIEQPGSSRAKWYPRVEHLLLKVKSYRVGWWMKHYGSLSPLLGGAFFSLGRVS